MSIKVIKEIPSSPLRESESMRRALIGCVLRINHRAVEGIRAEHPDISPAPPQTYEVPLAEVLHALHRANRIEAASDWSIVAPHLVRIPYDCAKLVPSE